MKNKGIEVYSDLRKNKEIYSNLPDKIKISFDSGAKVEYSSRNPKRKIHVSMDDLDGNYCLYSTQLHTGTFAYSLRRWMSNLLVTIRSEEGKEISKFRFPNDLKGNNVVVVFESSSLGDTLAWFPAVEEFRKKTGCVISVVTFWNRLFEGKYEEIKFLEPGGSFKNPFAIIPVGWYKEEDLGFHRRDPRTISLQEVSFDHLGLDYTEEIIPKINGTENPHNQEMKYVCISTHGTAAAKIWQRPGGWQKVVDYLVSLGYEVKIIQKEPNPGLHNVTDLTGEIDIMERVKVISGCSFFVGIGSGVSWLAWACGKPVVMISGFSSPNCEFKTKNYRVINESVCNSCFNSTDHKFDRSNFFWCPLHENTERQHECSKLITEESVIESINFLIEDFGL